MGSYVGLGPQNRFLSTTPQTPQASQLLQGITFSPQSNLDLQYLRQQVYELLSDHAVNSDLDSFGTCALAAAAADVGLESEAVEHYKDCAEKYQAVQDSEAAAWALYKAAQLMFEEPLKSFIEEDLADAESSLYILDPRVELLSQAMELGPDMPELLLLAALVESRKGGVKKAIRYANAAVQLGCARGMGDGDAASVGKTGASAAAPGALPDDNPQQTLVEGMGAAAAGACVSEVATTAGAAAGAAGAVPVACAQGNLGEAPKFRAAAESSAGENRCGQDKRACYAGDGAGAADTCNDSWDNSCKLHRGQHFELPVKTRSSHAAPTSCTSLASRRGRVDLSSYFEGPFQVLSEVYQQMGDEVGAREARGAYQHALALRRVEEEKPRMGLWHIHHRQVSCRWQESRRGWREGGRERGREGERERGREGGRPCRWISLPGVMLMKSWGLLT
jgi:hypothetical protein